ncbi:hypothetical protein [Thiolinea disciformis]|uniref:hypothetical protein n=1 Tax=Thiolinea disciformis TaxID=125614 RepID=UPI000367F44C|nr:hypothetical protein [Thiolinea disciformis]
MASVLLLLGTMLASFLWGLLSLLLLLLVSLLLFFFRDAFLLLLLSLCDNHVAMAVPN